MKMGLLDRNMPMKKFDDSKPQLGEILPTKYQNHKFWTDNTVVVGTGGMPWEQGKPLEERKFATYYPNRGYMLKFKMANPKMESDKMGDDS